jgi:hypothetical protein
MWRRTWEEVGVQDRGKVGDEEKGVRQTGWAGRG